MFYDYAMKIRDAQIFSDKVIDIIKVKQQELGLSNYALAQKANLSEALLSYIFHHHRRPTLYTLVMITGAMDISLSDVIRQVEDEHREK